MTAPTRPVLRYHGGKWRLAPWIISHFPPHRVYVEPFGGAASVLLRKQRSCAEVYNDLDGEIVNLFRVLRDPLTAMRLRELVTLTPFARREFKDAYTPTTDPVERARRCIIRAFMGFGSASQYDGHATGFRANSNRSGTTPAHDWANWPGKIATFTERLGAVIIEERPAGAVIGQHDRADCLHYVDPPYVERTRGSLRGVRQKYRHEMTDDDHRRLAEVLHDVSGMVVLSGYPCDLYDTELFPTWERHERAHMADGARPRTEVLWLNPACSRALAESKAQMELGA
jgi:DNA adenine methylase